MRPTCTILSSHNQDEFSATHGSTTVRSPTAPTSTSCTLYTNTLGPTRSFRSPSNQPINQITIIIDVLTAAPRTRMSGQSGEANRLSLSCGRSKKPTPPACCHWQHNKAGPLRRAPLSPFSVPRTPPQAVTPRLRVRARPCERETALDVLLPEAPPACCHWQHNKAHRVTVPVVPCMKSASRPYYVERVGS